MHLCKVRNNLWQIIVEYNVHTPEFQAWGMSNIYTPARLLQNIYHIAWTTKCGGKKLMLCVYLGKN